MSTAQGLTALNPGAIDISPSLRKFIFTIHVLVRFSSLWPKIPDKNKLEEEKFFLANGFRA